MLHDKHILAQDYKPNLILAEILLSVASIFYAK